jgi:hypothetical protein
MRSFLGGELEAGELGDVLDVDVGGCGGHGGGLDG